MNEKHLAKEDSSHKVTAAQPWDMLRTIPCCSRLVKAFDNIPESGGQERVGREQLCAKLLEIDGLSRMIVDSALVDYGFFFRPMGILQYIADEKDRPYALRLANRERRQEALLRTSGQTLYEECSYRLLHAKDPLAMMLRATKNADELYEKWDVLRKQFNLDYPDRRPMSPSDAHQLCAATVKILSKPKRTVMEEEGLLKEIMSREYELLPENTILPRAEAAKREKARMRDIKMMQDVRMDKRKKLLSELRQQSDRDVVRRHLHGRAKSVEGLRAEIALRLGLPLSHQEVEIALLDAMPGLKRKKSMRRLAQKIRDKDRGKQNTHYRGDLTCGGCVELDPGPVDEPKYKKMRPFKVELPKNVSSDSNIPPSPVPRMATEDEWSQACARIKTMLHPHEEAPPNSPQAQDDWSRACVKIEAMLVQPVCQCQLCHEYVGYGPASEGKYGRALAQGKVCTCDHVCLGRGTLTAGGCVEKNPGPGRGRQRAQVSGRGRGGRGQSRPGRKNAPHAIDTSIVKTQDEVAGALDAARDMLEEVNEIAREVRNPAIQAVALEASDATTQTSVGLSEKCMRKSSAAQTERQTSYGYVTLGGKILPIREFPDHICQWAVGRGDLVLPEYPLCMTWEPAKRFVRDVFANAKPKIVPDDEVCTERQATMYPIELELEMHRSHIAHHHELLDGLNSGFASVFMSNEPLQRFLDHCSKTYDLMHYFMGIVCDVYHRSANKDRPFDDAEHYVRPPVEFIAAVEDGQDSSVVNYNWGWCSYERGKSYFLEKTRLLEEYLDARRQAMKEAVDRLKEPAQQQQLLARYREQWNKQTQYAGQEVRALFNRAQMSLFVATIAGLTVANVGVSAINWWRGSNRQELSVADLASAVAARLGWDRRECFFLVVCWLGAEFHWHEETHFGECQESSGHRATQYRSTEALSRRHSAVAEFYSMCAVRLPRTKQEGCVDYDAQALNSCFVNATSVGDKAYDLTKLAYDRMPMHDRDMRLRNDVAPLEKLIRSRYYSQYGFLCDEPINWVPPSELAKLKAAVSH